MQNKKIILLSFISISILLIIYFTNFNSTLEYTQIKSTISNDTKVKAVLMETSYGGATGATLQKIYIINNDDTPNGNNNYEILKFQGEFQKMKWTNNILFVHIKSNRVFKFKNFIWNKKFNITYKIKLIEDL